MMHTQWNKARRILRGSAVRSVAQISGGTLAGQGIVLLVSPLLTRLYSPSEFGFLGVFAAVTAVVGILASLRFDQALPVVPEEDRYAVFKLSALLLIGTTAISLIVLLIGWTWVQPYTQGHALLFVVSVPLGVLWAGTYQLLSAWAVRLQEYRTIGQTKVTQGVGMAATQVVLGVSGLGAVGLVLGDLVGKGGGIGALSRSLRGEWRRIWEPGRAALRSVASKYRDYPTYMTLATLFSSSSLYLPYFLLQPLYGARTVGFFLLVQRIVSTPTSLVGKAVANVFFGRASDAARQGRAIGPLLRVGMVTLAAVGIPGVVVVMFIAKDAFHLIFGAEWEEAGRYVQYLAPAYLANFVVVPFSQVLNVLGVASHQALVDGVRLALCAAAFGWAAFGSLRADHAIAAYSAALFTSYIFQLVVIRYAVNRAESIAS